MTERMVENGPMNETVSKTSFLRSLEFFGASWGRLERDKPNLVPPQRIEFEDKLTPELREELKRLAEQGESAERPEKNASKVSNLYTRVARHLAHVQSNPLEPWEFRTRVLFEMGLDCDTREIRDQIWAPTVEERNPSTTGNWHAEYENFKKSLLQSQSKKTLTRRPDWNDDGECLACAWKCLISMREETIKELVDEDARKDVARKLLESLKRDGNRVCKLLEKSSSSGLGLEKLKWVRYTLARRQDLLQESFIKAGKYLIKEYSETEESIVS
ncbi:hypothetical protein K491DRAFT_679848 [Lophiostoma macrostomum CBS 122681]|uniref:Uncharacterized protein n=1 Tax=Lophiostoma macrostomum CBS 122681 TaxID=1314788 RepID=A0A6A6T3C1_9PLEO|nr:hypothetical protein K491DRAFT_679848 [Lophiostoma macrostomum CBS 122681]